MNPSRRQSHKPKHTGRPAPKALKAPKPKARQPVAKSNFNLFPLKALKDDTQPPTDERPLRERAFLPLDGSSPVSLEHHTDGCRWPVGEPALCCNLPVHPASIYCPAHHAAAYRELPARKGGGLKVIGISR